MIFLFLGEYYFRQKLLKTWKDSFSVKFSELNIFHIKNILDYDINFYSQNLTSIGLFSTKNLFIIDDFPITTGENDKNIINYQDYFIDILDKINTENIVIFNNYKADKRSKLYKKIIELGEVKNFEINDSSDLFQKLNNLYKNKISTQAINQMINLKGINFMNIKNELDKLLITKDYIDIGDLINVSKDIEESIFDIINDILNLNIKKFILKLRDLKNFMNNNYLLYNSLISNLRIYFYIFLLKKYGYKQNEISNLLVLGKRSFLAGKNFKIDYPRLEKIYFNLISIDAKMKKGIIIGNDENDIIFEIEKSLII